MKEAHEKSRAVWDEMASGWETYRDFMWRTTHHVAEWLVENANAGQGDIVLDIAGGAGDIGLLAAERVGPGGKVIETDFAPQMVEAARRRVTEVGASNVECRILDAHHMELPDSSVDAIVCRWGFMLMLDPGQALKECRRVLKPDGRLAFSVWGGPEQNPWVTVTGMTMMQLGYQPGGDPFGPGGMFSLSDHDAIRKIVSEAGFTEVSVDDMPVTWSYSSFDEAWAFMTQVAGAIATAVKEMPPDRVDELRDALESNLEAYKTSQGLALPGVTVNVVAV